MKKKYIVPQCESFVLNVRSVLCLSKGDNEGDGVAESRKFRGSSIWEEEDEEETEETL